tara:strand:- start:95 stop:556 length:462 start_codon:yes stop_codon:yes gene_type:complete
MAIALLAGCSDDENRNPAPRASSFEQTEELENLRQQNNDLNWEINRLKPKVPTESGLDMVRSKTTGLWYLDVQREPFTGRAVEKFEDGTWKGEVSFLKGKKDGVERYWHPNGLIRIESQWMNGELHGFVTEWDNRGKLLERRRFRRGEEVSVP